MFALGVSAAILGNCLIGVGQALQKFAINQISGSAVQVRHKRQHAPTPPPGVSSSSRNSNSRLSNKYWILGFVMCYVGEAAGNWVGMANASVAVITPLGILSVLVNAYFANKWLNERIGAEQRQAYALIIIGVLIILMVAPRSGGEDNVGGMVALVDGVKSTQDWVNLLTVTSSFNSSIIVLAFIGIWLLYMLMVRAVETIYMYVACTAVFGTITVLSSKAFTVLLRVWTSTSKDNKSPTPEDSSIGPAVSILLTTLIASSIAQEVLKQNALSRFPVSQFLPMFYAAFNVSSVLWNVYVFQEISGGLSSWLWFLFVFGSGIGVIYEGIVLLTGSEEDEEQKTS